MKKLTFITVALLIDVAGLLSCKKEHVCEDCIGNNHPLLAVLAVAEPDTAIILPTDSVLLNGGKSSDPDGKMGAWQWTKISGPDSITIVNPTAAQTWVTHLKEGYYLIELKVTDSAGLFSKDTVQVTVLNTQRICDPLNRATIPIQFIPVAAIPIPKVHGFTTATAGNKLLLAGGRTGLGAPVSDVEIYDFDTQTWSTAHLSTARAEMTAVTVGNEIFFVGGEVPGFYGTTRMDIYDASANTWSFSDLPSTSTVGSLYSYAVVENKVFFVTNRAPSGKVDVYDTSTGLWSEINVPEQQGALTATTAGNKVYFAGGSVNVVNIYDNATGALSTTSPLSQPTAQMGSIYVNGKIYWAGGDIGHDPVHDRPIGTCKVEIRDVTTGSSSFTNLSGPNDFEYNHDYKPIYYNNKIIFRGWNYFDIYDPQSSTWSIGQFPQKIVFIESVILVNNALYAIGGNDESLQLSTQIWKLQF